MLYFTTNNNTIINDLINKVQKKLFQSFVVVDKIISIINLILIHLFQCGIKINGTADMEVWVD
jgi:hypothetical protein